VILKPSNIIVFHDEEHEERPHRGFWNAKILSPESGGDLTQTREYLVVNVYEPEQCDGQKLLMLLGYLFIGV